MKNIFDNYISTYKGLEPSCWSGIFLNFMESIFIGVYYFLPLYFINELGIPITCSGLMVSFYGAGTILGGFFGGKLSDRYNPISVCISSLILQGIFLLTLLKSQNTNLITLELFSMGIASYAFITSNHAWVLQECENDEQSRLKAINILNAASNLGSGLSAAIISILAIYGFKNILGVSGLCAIGSAFYFFLANRSATKNDKVVNVNIVNKTDESNLANKPSRNNFYLILTCLFLVGFIIFQMNSTYAIYIKKTFPEYGIKGLGFLYALNCFLVVLLQTPVVHLFRNCNKMLVAGIGAFLLGLGMLMLNYPFLFLIALISCVIYTIGEMLFFSMAQLICYHYGDEHNKGSSLGLYRVIYACSRIAGPITGAYLFQQFGGNLLWTLCGLIGLFSLTSCSLYAKSN